MKAISFKKKTLQDFELSQSKEYLETNQLGVYSSSTILNCNSRKYHGIFVPRQDQLSIDNYVLLSTLLEKVEIGSQTFDISTVQFPDVVVPKGFLHLTHFELKDIPHWSYKVGKNHIDKELLVVPSKHQVIIRYTNLGPASVQLNLRPLLANRRIHDLNEANEADFFQFESAPNGMAVSYKKDVDTLFLQLSDPSIVQEEKLWYYQHFYPVEQDRGYADREDLLHPGWIETEIKSGNSVYLSISLAAEHPQKIKTLFEQGRKNRPLIADLESALSRAADQFISSTARGTEICAGFHWFGRWGRDTFIALPGLLLTKGKIKEAEAVIDAMIKDMDGGLLTNIGVGNKKEYNSIGASLWLFRSFYELELKVRDKKRLWKKYKKVIQSILESYQKGTYYNIHQQENGLLYGGAPNVALTWMDAKVDNEGVTPRRGCPVEINALWFHAISLSLDWALAAQDQNFLKKWKEEPQRIQKSFLKYFWSDEKGYLADVVNKDQTDWSVRPNQIFAASLPYSMLDQRLSKLVLQKVEKHLFTPYGLRTLSPEDPRYHKTYLGNQKTRDASYHQGIIWPWLLGPYFDALIKNNPTKFIRQLQKIKSTFARELSDEGLGTISELYHENPDFEGTGTISQAWSVSEIYRIIQLEKEQKP